MSQPPVDMLHLFQLGPIVAGTRRTWLLSGVTEKGGFLHPFIGTDVPSGLATLSARVGAAGLRVEPALEGAGARFGIPAEPLPASARVPRAVLAFASLTSFRLFRTPGVVAGFLESCVAFEKARPWTRCGTDERFGILMAERWRCWTRELVVLGSGGRPRGLELHERSGPASGLFRRRRGLDSLLVTFGTGPAWAVEAVREAYGLDEIPTVLRMEPGSRQEPRRVELLQLAAALRSAAILGAEGAYPEYGAEVVLSADGHEIEAVAAPISPERVTRPVAVTVPETPRNAPCPCGSGRKFKRCHLTDTTAAGDGRTRLTV